MIAPRRPPRGGRVAAGLGWLAPGVAFVALYIVAAVSSWLPPVRLLYDGYAPPPPYRWVHPPAARAEDNEPAVPGTGVVPFGPQGSLPRVIATDDAQAAVTFPAGAIAPRPNASSVRVTILPLDPREVGPAPAGLRLDGNAYRIQAYYAPSASDAVLTEHITVVLAYPIHATIMLRSTGAAWVPLSTIRYAASLQVLANSDRLGVFVAAAPYSRWTSWWVAYVAAGAALLAAIGGLLFARRRAQAPQSA